MYDYMRSLFLFCGFVVVVFVVVVVIRNLVVNDVSFPKILRVIRGEQKQHNQEHPFHSCSFLPTSLFAIFVISFLYD